VTEGVVGHTFTWLEEHLHPCRRLSTPVGISTSAIHWLGRRQSVQLKEHLYPDNDTLLMGFASAERGAATARKGQVA
jgi:hypothetical protein